MDSRSCLPGPHPAPAVHWAGAMRPPCGWRPLRWPGPSTQPAPLARAAVRASTQGPGRVRTAMPWTAAALPTVMPPACRGVRMRMWEEGSGEKFMARPAYLQQPAQALGQVLVPAHPGTGSLPVHACCAGGVAAEPADAVRCGGGLRLPLSPARVHAAALAAAASAWLRWAAAVLVGSGGEVPGA